MVKQGNNNLPEFSIIYIVKFRIQLRFDDKFREFSVMEVMMEKIVESSNDSFETNGSELIERSSRSNQLLMEEVGCQTR